MKQHLTFIFILLLTVTSQAKSQKLVFKTDLPSTNLYYWASDGKQLPYFDLAQMTRLDSVGDLEIHLSKKNVIYNISIENSKTFFKIYSTNNSVDTIYISNDNVSFEGNNKQCNDYLIRAEESDKYCQNYSLNFKHELSQINALADFKAKIYKYKQKDYTLLKAQSFSNDFLKQQSLEIEIRYNALLLKKMISLANISQLTSNWISEFENINFLFLNQNSRKSAWYNEVLKDFICFKRFIIEELNPENLIDSTNTFFFDNYCEIISDENLEYALASLLYEDSFQHNYSGDIPTLFQRFNALFPTSEYRKILEPKANEVFNLYNVHNQNEKTIIMNYETDPTSISEILTPFLGKVIYIDIWATWCVPCIKGFSNTEDLNKLIYTLGQDIVTFYISIDEERNNKKWLNMINHFDLNGYHYRVNSETAQIIYKSFGNSKGILEIPRYILVNKNGEIAYHHAASPSEIEKLTEQIKSLLK